MARQPKANDKKKEENVTVLSNEPIEEVPDRPGEMTTAASAAAPHDPVNKGVARGVGEASANAQPKAVQWYRVLVTKRIKGMTGFRAVLNAGKELNDQQYNVKQLKAQGVQLEKIDASEVSTY